MIHFKPLPNDRVLLHTNYNVWREYFTYCIFVIIEYPKVGNLYGFRVYGLEEERKNVNDLLGENNFKEYFLTILKTCWKILKSFLRLCLQSSLNSRWYFIFNRSKNVKNPKQQPEETRAVYCEQFVFSLRVHACVC